MRELERVEVSTNDRIDPLPDPRVTLMTSMMTWDERRRRARTVTAIVTGAAEAEAEAEVAIATMIAIAVILAMKEGDIRFAVMFDD